MNPSPCVWFVLCRALLRDVAVFPWALEKAVLLESRLQAVVQWTQDATTLLTSPGRVEYTAAQAMVARAKLDKVISRACAGACDRIFLAACCSLELVRRFRVRHQRLFGCTLRWPRQTNGSPVSWSSS
jgi:hypothetical protein